MRLISAGSLVRAQSGPFSSPIAILRFRIGHCAHFACNTSPARTFGGPTEMKLNVTYFLSIGVARTLNRAESQLKPRTRRSRHPVERPCAMRRTIDEIRQ